MEIILKTDIKGLGYKNDLVSVKPGYGRNYLIPQGYAVLATSSNKKILAENIKQAAHKAEKIKADAEEIASKLSGVTLEIKAKIGETGKIFGKVTTLQISDALAAQGFDIDRKKIAINTPVDGAGEFVAEVDLHREVKTDVKFVVVAE
ncbi:50S ribosomal protein L9 [Algoriphagus sp. NF]|jgi:large subunit ribosomal protein L9|uniref:Large ribosomal subunit protein bL9 n=3 Tax=Algoriphagus TaxID=246875 RepID=A0ABS7MZF8_9BACT|nr:MULTISPECIES: 50S ribosomal protein L9 [Algoriphagus]KPQ19604.1 MAG: LSU ribosomal protein L9 RplL [Algoriphagus marincola HL-49]MCR9082266.1 50S ribosomal protein L9 [Cyclobacteriaceae bacterium]MBY5949454.1 50S ribosomal protein L9 [Algoriphagus marincola]MDE0560788.1 50S ribosomal protein L9 [Algoriphagus sp. NF]TDK41600.1 50S ribosomal protein L9 [Algoriphagus aquimaris]